MNKESFSNETQLQTQREPFLGLGLWAIIGLALVGVPRVILHDLGVIHEGTFINMLFVFIPLVVWFAVVYAKRVRNPFLTLLAVGVCYGVLLAVTHQLLWNVAMDDTVRLGGNLSDLNPGAQEAIIRTFAAGSGVVIGTIVGAVVGFVTWIIMKITGRLPK